MKLISNLLPLLALITTAANAAPAASVKTTEISIRNASSSSSELISRALPSGLYIIKSLVGDRSMPIGIPPLEEMIPLRPPREGIQLLLPGAGTTWRIQSEPDNTVVFTIGISQVISDTNLLYACNSNCATIYWKLNPAFGEGENVYSVQQTGANQNGGPRGWLVGSQTPLVTQVGVGSIQTSLFQPPPGQLFVFTLIG